VADFTEATTVKYVEPGSYDVDIDSTWSVGDVPNGGYLLALILRAVASESPHPHPVSTSAHFVAPPSGGPARIRVDLLRAGRTTATLRATLVQDEVSRVEALITVPDAALVDAFLKRCEINSVWKAQIRTAEVKATVMSRYPLGTFDERVCTCVRLRLALPVPIEPGLRSLSGWLKEATGDVSDRP
jgi:hypothetical protein